MSAVPHPVLRPLGQGEAAAGAAVLARATPSPWTAPAFAAILGQPGGLADVALPDASLMPEQAVGVLLARVIADEAEVLMVGVVPDWRRRGLAAALLASCIGRSRALGARRLLLEVACRNEAARGLYAGFGFEEVGRRPGYYADTAGGRDDALVLARDISAHQP